MDQMTPAPFDKSLTTERQARLVKQFVAENFGADDLVSLARMIYVRVLFKLYGIAGGRGDRMTPIARQLTAEILREQVGFYVTAQDVQEFLDDEDEDEDAGESAPQGDATAKGTGSGANAGKASDGARQRGRSPAKI